MSKSLMICPSTDSTRGIQTVVPKQRVIRSAMLVLPLPGIPVEEHPAARVDGRAEHREDLVGDQQVRERPPQVGLLGMLGR